MKLLEELETAQDVFDYVVAKLKAQGKKSSLPGFSLSGSCRYRQGDLRCAAGWLIPDSLYSEHFENLPVTPDMLPANCQPHLELIAALQSAHDSSYGSGEVWVTAFLAEARLLAKCLDLNTDATNL